jgi:hypothetical protein
VPLGDPHAVSDQLYEHVEDIRSYIEEGDTVADEYREALLNEHDLSDADEVNTALDGAFPNARPTDEWDTLDALVDPFPEAAEWSAHEESGSWASETLRGLPAIAVDGSELEPTDELNVPIGVTQVAWLVNHHQSPPAHELETETQVLAPEDVIVDAGSYSYVDAQQVQHHRYEQEIGTVVNLIERHADLDPPPVVFVDGSLGVSYANLFSDDVAERYQRAMSELLAASRHHEVPVVGYVAGSRASDIGDMVQRLNPSALGDGPIARDAAIFAPLLESWGSRTALFVNRRDTSLDALETTYGGVEYGFGDRLRFCYTNIGAGASLDRLETLAWLPETPAPDECPGKTMFEYALTMVRGEAAVGQGYPEILQQVDAEAVLTGSDRDSLITMLQRLSNHEDLDIEWNPKAVSKRRRR